MRISDWSSDVCSSDLEGRPMGVIANNPLHLAGAIDADGADKAARFMQLCDAYDLPILFLCDTPGIMVGPDAEQTALVRHVSRLFVTDRKSVGSGKRVSVRVDLGGRGVLKKKKK